MYIWVALLFLIVVGLVILCWFCGELARLFGIIIAVIIIAVFLVACFIQQKDTVEAEKKDAE